METRIDIVRVDIRASVGMGLGFRGNLETLEPAHLPLSIKNLPESGIR